MGRPLTTCVQMPYRNPHASSDLILPVLVVCNTPDDELYRNITENAALDLPWLQVRPAHDLTAVMCGGGPSLVDYIEEIRDLQVQGAVVFAMNAASRFLHEHGIRVDYQVVADAKPETASLVDPRASHHFIASQVDPGTMQRAMDAGRGVTLWHLAIDEAMDRLFPDHRRKAGGYALTGGGAAVGNSALCVAYVRGFRRFEIFGYDSSHRGEASHAYAQPMNWSIPTCEVEWAGKTYRSSLAMKAQAEKFQFTARSLKQEDCTVNVHGDGLLPAMWNTQEQDLEERDKYRLLWGTDTYRAYSPGEQCVPQILEHLRPSGLVLDFGCGTGRASLELAKLGHQVLLTDFADNCRDQEAMSLPFLEWDLTKPGMPVSAPFGICTDVMEHIPPADVDAVIENIMAAAERVFFQISTTEDHCGALIGQHLHLTVQYAGWWREHFEAAGHSITWSAVDAGTACFVVHRNRRHT